MTEHDRSEARTQEYIDEVTNFMQDAIDTDNTTLSVEVSKEEI